MEVERLNSILESLNKEADHAPQLTQVEKHPVSSGVVRQRDATSGLIVTRSSGTIVAAPSTQ